VTDRLLPQSEDLRQTVAVDRVSASRRALADSIVAEFDTHQRTLFTFVRSVLHDPDLADEIVQEAFLRLVREAASGRMPDNPGGWLYRVCTNLVTSQLRQRVVRSRLRQLIPPLDPTPSAEDTLIHRERHDRVQARLAALPDDARMAVLLAGRGLTGQQIAAALGRSEAATRVLLYRARRRLREEIAAEGLE
jgi:RNA polymerase sigma-70 factor (ECF subfamily)